MEEAVISAKKRLWMLPVSKITSLSFHMLVSCNSFFEELDLPAVKEAELAAYIRDKSITGLKEFTKENPSQYDKGLGTVAIPLW